MLLCKARLRVGSDREWWWLRWLWRRRVCVCVCVRARVFLCVKGREKGLPREGVARHTHKAHCMCRHWGGIKLEWLGCRSQNVPAAATSSHRTLLLLLVCSCLDLFAQAEESRAKERGGHHQPPASKHTHVPTGPHRQRTVRACATTTTTTPPAHTRDLQARRARVCTVVPGAPPGRCTTA